MKAVAIAVLALTLTSVPARADKSSVRLDPGIAPQRQALVLRVDPAETRYAGEARVDLEVREAKEAVRLHAEGIEIGHAALRTAAGVRDAVVEREAEDLVRIVPDGGVPAGPSTLELAFEAAFETRAVGLYRTEHQGDAYLFTQFEADDARRAFPCFDEPAFKIPWDVTVIAPEGAVVIANTPEVSSTVEGGWRTTVFAPTMPLPSYLIALAVGPFETVDVPGTSAPTRIVTPRGQAGLAGYAVEMTPPLLAALERWFDRPYPYAKLDLIAVPEFWPGAMENAGAITYRDGILLAEPGQVSVSWRRNHAHITAHELAHQWFGDLVTMQWWDDLWLNESFADWMGDKITEEVYPEYRHMALQRQGAQGTLSSDARSTARPIRREIASTDQLMEGVGAAYEKGRTVLGMFEAWLGEETFRRGVLAYLEAHAWGNATADDLWRALDGASGRPVSKAMAGFLEQPGVPLVRVESVEGGRVKLSQGRFANLGDELPPLSWQIPVVLRFADARGPQSRSLLLQGESAEIDLGAEGEIAWLYPNGGGTGYYRWQLPEADVLHLVALGDGVLDADERGELMADANALVDAGMMSGATFVDLLASYRGDPDPLVISALVRQVDALRGSFVDEALEEPFSRWVRLVLGPAMDRFGRERAEGEGEDVSYVRPRLVAALADWGRDEELQAWCRELAADVLEHPDRVDPAVAGTSLSVAATWGDEALAAKLRQRFESTEDPVERSRLLGALSSFRDPGVMAGILEWALESVRPNEYGALGRGMADTEAGREQYFRFVVDHYDTLAAMVPPFMRANFPFVARGCSTERMEKARAFFGDPSRAVAGTAAALDRLTVQVNECVRLRAREGASVAQAILRATDGPPPHGEPPPSAGRSSSPPSGGAGSPRR